MIDASPRRPTPLRNIAELAVLAAYLLVVPAWSERVLRGFGIAAEGIAQVAFTSALYVGFFVLAVAIVKLRGQRLRDLGLRVPPNLLASTLVGVGVAAAFFVAVEIMKRTGVMTSDWSDASEWRNNVALLLAWVAMITVFTGVVEEFIYRGLVMDRIASALGGGRVGLVAAVLGQAVLFALAHAYGNLELILFSGAFALAYAALYLRDGSLWAPIVAHIVYDVSRVVFFFYVATYGDPLALSP